MVDGGVIVLYTEGDPCPSLIRLALAAAGWAGCRTRPMRKGETPDLVVLWEATEEREELVWNRGLEAGARVLSFHSDQ